MKTISFDEAFTRTMNAAGFPAEEVVPLQEAVDRVLAKDVVSDMHMPPFNKAAMDGYACRRADLGNALFMVEEIAAGQLPQKEIGPNECAKIMTGAPVPHGADVVVMVEYTECDADGRVRFVGGDTRDNICKMAEDITAGDVVLGKGELVSPAHIAVLATVGCVNVPVYKRPVVGVIATGSELVDPAQKAVGAQIRNSNSFQLVAQIKKMGSDAVYFGIAEDTIAATTKIIKTAAASCDVLVLSGGVSMGDFDFVPHVLKSLGFDFQYDSVAMQPGRPTVFAIHPDQTYCFGLPGNPVSTFVIFEVLLKPFLFKLMGHDFAPRVVTAQLATTIHRKKTKRQSSLPVRFTGPNVVSLLEYHGSAHINSLCSADGFVTIPVGEATVEKGSIVHVRCL